MKKLLFLLSSFSILLIACTKDKGQVPAKVTTVDTSDNCNYTDTIAAIINTNCAISGCHESGSLNGDFSTYANLKPYVDNGKFKKRVLVDQDMPTFPVDPLSDIVKSKIACWLDGGALEAASNPVGGGDCSTPISYSLTIAPIVSANCATNSSCHGSGSVNGDYTAYTGLSSKVTNGSLNTRIVVVGDMASFPTLATPLSDTQISNINCWIKQDGPNN